MSPSMEKLATNRAAGGSMMVLPFDPVAMMADMRAAAAEVERRRAETAVELCWGKTRRMFRLNACKLRLAVEHRLRKPSAGRATKKPRKPAPSQAELLSFLAAGGPMKTAHDRYGITKYAADIQFDAAYRAVGAFRADVAVVKAIVSGLIQPPFIATGPSRELSDGSVAAVDPETGRTLWLTPLLRGDLKRVATGGKARRGSMSRVRKELHARTVVQAIAKAVCLGMIDVGWHGSPGHVTAEWCRPRTTKAAVESARLAAKAVQLFDSGVPCKYIAERLSRPLGWVQHVVKPRSRLKARNAA